ncbi:DUF5642 family protein [Mycolicibacterium mageritense]|uniref:DUF5642 family protein n=1 Tax=Mycolicibacterium mageritense TaxID=53462 RepID=UPI00103C5D5A|nr:DUF5642 family protein [Mycolicibacterium mageritense]MCC9181831.1 DUF5642 family protein [Mycolicibacterium mageritense]
MAFGGCSKRRRAVVALVFGMAVLLTGCRASVTDNAEVTSTAETPAQDISRLADIKDDLPSGYNSQWFPSSVLNEQQAANADDVASVGMLVTVDPPACVALMKPVNVAAGTESAALRAYGPQEEQISIGAMRSNRPLQADVPSAGCDRISFEGTDSRARGTVDRLPAPKIDGATTAAVRVEQDGAPEVADYVYYAIDGDQTFVSVHARVDVSSGSQEMYADLLVKSVAAVRGE